MPTVDGTMCSLPVQHTCVIKSILICLDVEFPTLMTFHFAANHCVVVKTFNPEVCHNGAKYINAFFPTKIHHRQWILALNFNFFHDALFLCVSTRCPLCCTSMSPRRSCFVSTVPRGTNENPLWILNMRLKYKPKRPTTMHKAVKVDGSSANWDSRHSDRQLVLAPRFHHVNQQFICRGLILAQKLIVLRQDLGPSTRCFL